MKELNQLEKQLQVRSVKELEEVVDTFLNSVAKIKDKYGGNRSYHYVDVQNTNGTMCIAPSTIKSHLLYMLKENHLESMLRHKSKELLAKLDLMS